MRTALIAAASLLMACATPPAQQTESTGPLSEAERAEMQALVNELDAEAYESFQDQQQLNEIAEAWRLCGIGAIDRGPIRAHILRNEDERTRARFARLFALQARATFEPPPWMYPTSPCDGGYLEDALAWLAAHPPSPWDIESFERPALEEDSSLSEEEEEEYGTLTLGLYGSDYAFSGATVQLAAAIRHFIWCGAAFDRTRAEAHLFTQAALPESERTGPAIGLDSAMSADTIERARRLMELTAQAARRDRVMWRALGVEEELLGEACGAGPLAVTRRGVEWAYELEEGP